MAKIYRLFDNKGEKKDWESIAEPYGPSVIEKIENPDGDMPNEKRKDSAPTSIPSPFARIDLFRSAFEYVKNSENLDGATIYHGLVSDCFDVAEMFFNIDKLGSRAYIETWDKTRDLETLKNSSNPKHQLLGETLELYLKQDAKSNNFDLLRKLYFIFYDNKIVGGTSPTTLFFTSANDLSFANIDNGNDVFFDNDLKPLYKRDPEFQKYIYTFINAFPELKSKMSALSDYLEKSLEQLDRFNNTVYSEISSFNNKNSEELKDLLRNSYAPLDIGENNNIEILGFPLKKRKTENSADIAKSQLAIASHKATLKPLVLQNNLSEPLNYTSDNVKWNSDWQVPYFDERPLEERVLPGQLDKYPYLTVSDFLQPQIIKLPFKLNAANFFDGNIVFENNDDNISYLLPLTKRFFEYFDTDELERPLKNGLKRIEIKAYTHSVEVTLRIPIKGNENIEHITFHREYSASQYSKIDLVNNKGVVLNNRFSLAVFPFKRMVDHNFYRVMALDRSTDEVNSHNNLKLSFYTNNNIEINAKGTTRTLKKDDFIQTDFYALENSFDYIEIGFSQNNGVLIPLFKTYEGNDAYRFAVDFGTTNTHIEYRKIGNNTHTAFDINANDIQYQTLHASFENEETTLFNEYIRHQFFPKLINPQAEFSFPIRTTTGEKEGVSFNSEPLALADINIPFDYEKYASKRNTNISTTLKWSDFQEENSPSEWRVKKFIEELLLLIRTKVICNTGKLNATELVWFYPSSMNPNKIGNLEEIWTETFHKYFGVEKTFKVSESIAPFYFYNKNRRVYAQSVPVVSIDIGGGTSDIVIFKEDKPKILTSIKYAANTIFGDGYGSSLQSNGFVIKYKDIIKKIIQNNNLTDIETAFNQILDRGKSEDLIAFFFSLANNKNIKEKRIPLSFNQFLSKDNDFKIVFLLFFSSLIYHIAKLMKRNKLNMPNKILLSGTGSKTILIANGNKNLEKLNSLTALIFNEVYGETNAKIELFIEDKPKEVTCKGGLELSVDKDTEINTKNIKSVLIGDTNDTLVNSEKLTYEDINEELQQSVVKEVHQFIDLFFSLNKKMNFYDYFGVNPKYLKEYETQLKTETLNALNKGVSIKMESLKGEKTKEIDEPLFFYPLTSAINELSYKIATKFK